MALFGVGLDVTVNQLNYEFRLALKRQGWYSVNSLEGIFQVFDINGNGKLCIKEFEAALARCGYLYINHRLFPKIVELQALMKYYDKDHDGSISYEEFVSGLR